MNFFQSYSDVDNHQHFNGISGDYSLEDTVNDGGIPAMLQDMNDDELDDLFEKLQKNPSKSQKASAGIFLSFLP